MKKIIYTSIFSASILLSSYNFFSSLSSKPISDICLSNIEALAQHEGGNGDCVESLKNSRTDYYSDGSFRMIGEYQCGNGMGNCYKGTVTIYCNSNGVVVGTDDQRMFVYCS